jgi:hypothetical protein
LGDEAERLRREWMSGETESADGDRTTTTLILYKLPGNFGMEVRMEVALRLLVPDVYFKKSDEDMI